ncbi:MAG: MmgE/PrpD family protein [Lapillicoccus sp.]
MTPRPERPAYFQGLGTAVARTTWAAAPAEVRDRVVDLVADCVAVAALGSARAELRRLAAVHDRLTPTGASSVLGSARGWPPMTAMLLNATAMAADQLQDGHRMARGHPASHVVPAVLALAEHAGSDGTELLSAVLAGYEAGIRVGRAMGGTPAGVHDIGTWGQVAVAAATARLLAPGDADAARRALDLAGSAVLLTDAHTVFGGYAGSHTFLGSSVQAGAGQGMAAVAGLAAGPGALSRHLGTVGASAWDPAPLSVAGTWDGYEVLDGYVKVHASCAHLHGVNDAVADLTARGVRGRDVASVRVRAFAGAALFDTVADGELAARFSVPTTVAVGLLDGRVDESTMTDDRVRADDVRDLAARVEVVHDPALDDGCPAGRPARVTAVLRDGTLVEAAADRPRGDADRALSRVELRTKATRLLRHRFGDAGPSVLEAVHALATGMPVAALGAAIRHAAGGPS